MAEREQIKKTPARSEQQSGQGSAGAASKAGSGQELKAELDDLLDEIDEVLETNAEEFVKSYIQKGGQ